MRDYYYLHDHLGSVIGITDATGSLIEHYEYDPFGKVRILDPATGSLRAESIISNPYMFTGRRWEPEIGLYYYRARYYDAVQGRFISPDPARYIDGFNLYTYCNNNPIIQVDPWGLVSIPFKNDDIEQGIIDAGADVGIEISNELARVIREEMSMKELNKLRNKDVSIEDKLDILEDIAERVKNDPDVSEEAKDELRQIEESLKNRCS